MSIEITQSEHPYVVKIETSKGHTAIPIVFLTASQIASFLQSDFKRLVEEAGVSGVRVHLERATAADYEKVLSDVARYLRTGIASAA